MRRHAIAVPPAVPWKEGKSSVLALALRARDPDGGRVTLGGTDRRKLALSDVRSRSAWAPQAPQVLGGSLAENLRLGRHDASEDELKQVMHAVGLDEVLDAVGLDGWVGESGERLSAGERSRVGLARALLSPADVLLLDEPTAHLDAPLAAVVLDRLAAQCRTVLLVTHRPDELDGRWRVVDLQASVLRATRAPVAVAGCSGPGQEEPAARSVGQKCQA
jgi:ABC-type transport system involved in cytochrome bd biosynthesis fused ATPase/permease subunit